MKNIEKLFKEAQKAQEELQRQMESLALEASSGGGMVSVKMNGAKHLLQVKIDPEAIKSGDVEMLEDLIVAAVNEAARRVDEEMSNQIRNLMGGLKLPGFKL